jgi:serine protease Do
MARLTHRRLFSLVVYFCPAVILAQSDPITKTGTGFVVDGATIITNLHVVDGCLSISALVGGENRPVQLAASDKANDLALLHSPQPLPAVITLRSGDQRLRVGETIIALGYPLQGVVASSLTVTTGSLSALAGLNDDTRMFQLTAPVQPGNSGGPAVDTSGHLMGIVASKLSPLWAAAHTGDLPQNVNFAIRSQVVQAFFRCE